MWLLILHFPTQEVFKYNSTNDNDETEDILNKLGLDIDSCHVMWCENEPELQTITI